MCLSARQSPLLPAKNKTSTLNCRQTVSSTRWCFILIFYNINILSFFSTSFTSAMCMRFVIFLFPTFFIAAPIAPSSSLTWQIHSEFTVIMANQYQSPFLIKFGQRGTEWFRLCIYTDKISFEITNASYIFRLYTNSVEFKSRKPRKRKTRKFSRKKAIYPSSVLLLSILPGHFMAFYSNNKCASLYFSPSISKQTHKVKQSQ